MTILAEIKLLIRECVHMLDGMGIPILTQSQADDYIRFLDQWTIRKAFKEPTHKGSYVGHCPVCHYAQTEGKAVDIDGHTATQDCYCLNNTCQAKWTDIYTLREQQITWTISVEPNT